ncbi:hypothetical protein EYF80_009373 [Liparis tanakae]|uniref:Uncharacterized protein n=1 Tax=Liparis tanakae TaxID=230148 RepID=A0A4Z2IQV3_9TELE|nr:hypothetical protein EYF80_009373 [Liparis tanakae]
MWVCRTVKLLAYFSRVFFISRSCGRSRWTFSSSCNFFCWQSCSFDTFSFSLLSIRVTTLQRLSFWKAILVACSMSWATNVSRRAK